MDQLVSENAQLREELSTLLEKYDKVVKLAQEEFFDLILCNSSWETKDHTIGDYNIRLKDLGIRGKTDKLEVKR